MKQAQEIITVPTRRQGNHDITRDIAKWVENQGIACGLLTVFLKHVSAHLAVQEHADRDDLNTFFHRLEVRGGEDFGEFTSSVTSVQLTIPITNGVMALGARQRIYLYEHRTQPQSRNLVMHFIGE